MKIRTQLLLGAAVFGAVLLVIAASVALTTEELDRLDRQVTLADRIGTTSSDLNYIANEYLLYGDPNQIDYWAGRSAALSADLANLTAASPGEEALVRAIADDQQRLQAVFDGIVARSAGGAPMSADQGAFQVAWSRVGVQTQALEYDASRLSALLGDQSDGLRFLNTLLIVALLALFALLLLTGFAVVGRRTLRSVNALQAGADAIGSGDLGYAIEAPGDDEVADLARSFNRMAADLAAITASRAELEAKEAELRSVALFPLQDPHPVLRADEAGRLIFSNPAGSALLGGLEAGRPLPGPLCSAAREAFAGGTRRTVEQRFGPTTYSISVVPLPEHRYVNLYFADISERMSAEEALREREQALQSIFRAAPVGIGISSDRVIRSVNAFLCTMTGYAADELLGQGTRMLYPSDDEYDRVGREKYGQIIETGIGAVETRWQRKDGGVIEVLLGASPMDRSSPFENVVTIALDLTPLREKEAALRESEAKYRNAVELSPDAILIHQDGAVVFANRAAAALVGAGGPAALLGRPILDLVHPVNRDLAAANIQQDLQGKESPVTAVELLRDDGTTVPVQGRGAAIPFGGRLAVQVVLRDVTRERLAEQALRESEAKYRHLFTHDLTGDFIASADGRILDCNPAFARMFGFSSVEEALSSNITGTYTAPEERAALLDRVLREGVVAYDERFRRRRDGTPIHVVETVLGVFDDDGALVRTQGYIIEDTERYRAEEALAADLDALTRMHALSGRLVEEEGLQPILQEIVDTAVAIMGAEKGTLKLVEGDSLRIAAVHGLEEPFLSFFSAAEGRASACGLAMREGERVVVPDVEESPLYRGTETLEVLRRGGVRAVQSTPLLSRGGEPMGVLTTHSGRPYTPDEHDLWRLDLLARQAADLIERARAAGALRAYAEDLARSNEDLERYAYVSSHDLQEPLRAIISFAQLLERRYTGQLGTDADEYIAFIVEGGNRMQTLILDLLAYSRVNSNPQEHRPTDAGAVMAAVERHLDLQLREAGATLTHDPLPMVTADPLQLEQVLVNLVSNAVKFRRPDVPLRIHVGARRLDGFWEFSVQDNGIGIEAEYFDRIFVIFQRLHTKDAYPGTGIGLAIVKRIVDRHGGTVRVESTPGEGTTFFFTVPDA